MILCSRYVWVAAILMVALVAGGCKSEKDGNPNVTKSKLAAIKPGMNVDEVRAIMGTGELVRQGAARINGERVPDEEHVWNSGERSITVSFVDGKVVYAVGGNM